MPRRLIVNADDYGISRERDRGIELAFVRGCVSSASFLLAGDSAADFPGSDVAARLPLGLHLNLTEGRPIAGAAHVPSLVGPDGQMLGKHGFRARLAAREVDLREVEAEVAAQLRRFGELVGRPPTHVDSHQHVHVLPALVDAIAGVLTRPEFARTRMRCPHEDLCQYEWFARSPARDFYAAVSAQAQAARPRYEHHGIRFPDRFVGNALFGTNNSVERFTQMIAGIGVDETVEFMCHPGYRSTTWDEFNQSADREHELAIFCDPRVRQALDERGVQLCSFSEL